MAKCRKPNEREEARRLRSAGMPFKRIAAQLVQHIYGAIQEYAGFDEPRWLDGPPRKSQSGRRPKEGAQQDELEEAA
jgi:hypothetical protein